MKLISQVLVLSLSLVSTLAHAESCTPASDSCGFYTCMETQAQCGTEGYLTSFGGPLCRAYLDHEPKLSNNLQTWFPKVRYCLQAALLQIGDQVKCDELDQKAFASHFDCYVSTGFCELTFRDQFEIIHLTGLEAMLNPSVIEVGLRVERHCHGLNY